MIRDLLHIILVRGESFLNITKQDESRERGLENKDNKNNESKNERNPQSSNVVKDRVPQQKDNKNNESKNERKTQSSNVVKDRVPQQKDNKNNDQLKSFKKSRTADVAVGRDEEKKKPFYHKFYYFCFRKKIQEKSDTEEEYPKNNIRYSVQKEALIATREVVASTCSSLFSVFFSHPLDVIKSKYQMLRYPRWQEEPFFPRQKFIYVLRNIYITKGFGRFYKHHWKSQTESVLQMVSVFWTYQRVTQFFEDNFGQKNEEVCHFAAGFFSATIPVLVLHPFHSYRQRLDIKHKLHKRFGEPVALSFVKQLKYWRPLYRGGLAIFAHMSLQYGLRFMFYQKIREHIAQTKTTSDKATDTNPYVSEVDEYTHFSNLELLSAGALAAILGDILAHPLDVIRSRLAMTPLTRQQYWYSHTCRKFSQCIKLIWRNERIWAFYAGLTPCILRSTVNTALMFAVHEKMREWLRPIIPT